MLKRARRTWTIAGSDVENLVHECIVETGGIRLRTWYKQRDDVNQPGDGEAGGNIFGEELATRLTGMLLTPVGDVTLPWNGGPAPKRRVSPLGAQTVRLHIRFHRLHLRHPRRRHRADRQDYHRRRRVRRLHRAGHDRRSALGPVGVCRRL